MSEEAPNIDFAMASALVERARAAYRSRDVAGFIAARHLVLLALGVEPPAPPPMPARRKPGAGAR